MASVVATRNLAEMELQEYTLGGVLGFIEERLR
jgi:hypothetical protein